MRRWLSLFMLVLLPLLSSWSVAAAYCGDEPVDRPAHVGHHVDAHHDDSVKTARTAGASDAHCDHCHSPGAMLPDALSDGHRAGASRARAVVPRGAACAARVSARSPEMGTPRLIGGAALHIP